MERNDVSYNVRENVKQWWLDLRKERRCNSTGVISKIVNKSSQREQDEVRALISSLIKQDIVRLVSSRDLVDLLTFCNALNGCFDNFVHAADGANIMFDEIIHFIDICIDECFEILFRKKTAKCNAVKVLELLHCLSRVLVLVLKCRRPLKHEGKSLHVFEVDPKTKVVIAKLSYKVSNFLMVDDILMDTKCNFVMASLLIREILLKSKERVIKYHQNFLISLPKNLEKEEFKLNILRFLLSNAILNTWSAIVIDVQSTKIYLKFFIQLCESYSRDIFIVLNASRALLLLVKSECFKDFILDLTENESHQISMLLSCVWMLLDHPVPCVRHSSKDFPQILARHEKFRLAMLNSLLSLPNDKRSYFITLGALANELGSQCLLKLDMDLSRNLVLALCDPTLVTHVVFALENLIIKDSLSDENFPEWCETWILPLLISLSNVPLVVAADIEKLLDGLFKKYPHTIFYVIEKWSEPKTDEDLRYIITALKIYHKHGFKLLTKDVKTEQKRKVLNTTSGDEENKKWKDLISEKLLRFCLQHNDDDIRLSAFSLIIQGLKSTEIYTEEDFNLIRYFLVNNLNNQHPATRQKTLSLIKKMLARYADSLTVVKRIQKKSDVSVHIQNYTKFKDWMVNFCFTNIFDGANFNRLSTVLSILLSTLDHMASTDINGMDKNICWKKIINALRSSYEENKIMAVAVALKFSIHESLAESTSVAKILFRKMCELCGKIEPPNVLTGSYVVQLLTECPSFKEIAEDYLTEDMLVDIVDSKLLCIQILTKLLRLQVERAEKNLIEAALIGPMYGTLFAIRLVIQKVNFSDIGSWDIAKSKWKDIIDSLIDLCFRMIRVVTCVVNSSSPEGHLPSDFQSDFEIIFDENIIAFTEDSEKEGFVEECNRSCADALSKEIEAMKLGKDEQQRRREEIVEECEKVIRRFNRIFFTINSCSSISENVATEFTVMLNKTSRLIYELKFTQISETSHAMPSINSYLECLCEIQEKLEKCVNIYKKNVLMAGRPTAQVLLLCAWRSIKEACLFLGDIISKLPLQKIFELELMSEEIIVVIGEELRTLLCEIKHRGAFEQVHVGFNHLISSLWKCPRKNLSELPVKWLQEILEEIKLPSKKQKMKFCSSRRSAGLPFLVQAIISSELQYVNSVKIHTLDSTMHTLLSIVEKDENSVYVECQIHSFNILRALFKHAMLGEHVAPYVSRALMVSIRGSRASAWSIRNSCNTLFSSLVIRIFGVARNKDALSKKNKMTSRIFFQRYPELYDFFLTEMRLNFTPDFKFHECHPQPNIFLIFLILARLYPPPTEDSMNIDFTDFLTLVNARCHSPTLKIRELGARALVSLIYRDKFREELELRFNDLYLSKNAIINNNHVHCVLLQIKTIMNEVSCNQSEFLEEAGPAWLENTQWILDRENERTATCYLIKISYLQILHIMMRICPSLRGQVEDILNSRMFPLDLKANKFIPGYFVFIENLHFIMFDIAAHSFLKSKNSNHLVQFFMSMLRSDIDDVKSIPLRFLNYHAAENNVNTEEEDVNSISVNVRDLSFIQNKTDLRAVKNGILCQEVIEYIVKYTTSFLRDICNATAFFHKVTTRLWISVISNLILENIVSVKYFYNFCDSKEISLLLKSLLHLIDDDDSDISVGAFLCYSAFFFESILHGGEPIQDSLSNIISQLNGFSVADADVRKRMAVSDIFNKYYNLFSHTLFKENNEALTIWMLPIRLMADDDPAVRKKSAELVYKYQKLLNECQHKQKLIIPLDDISLMKLTSVPSKSQEYLLDCYINLLGEENLLHLIVQMVASSVSAYINTISCDHVTKENEAGVFEKGNPNPFCEDHMIATLMCGKLNQLKGLVDMKAIFTQKLDSIHIKTLQNFLPTLTLPYFPDTLSELSIKIVNILNEEYSDNENVSLIPFYVDDMKKALDVGAFSDESQGQIG